MLSGACSLCRRAERYAALHPPKPGRAYKSRRPNDTCCILLDDGSVCGRVGVNAAGVCRRCCERKRRRGLRPETQRDYYRRWNYDLSADAFASMLAAQGGACAICRTTLDVSRPRWGHVDHDHVTGRVRGLLCHNCNVGLGHFRDDPALLRAAAEYLEIPRT